MPETSSAFVGLSADVVAAYVSNNSVPQTELPSLNRLRPYRASRCR